ncbi:hypothetical protein Rsub_06362 [Raphidocelis subcapitata]|uniref:Uncharacterized protein n=1 Tax=Raphidocelis subcapitata TaxID=307507 RepID=A0A2V0P0D1_9CHLO|nr:hypothetical protein Rsub_06362 [Raphidocelis subcapitata]|eukprot:GBF93324.1 hypothetical protein Rsub_06362 [Raphidocelis subcapitata]
MSQHHERLRPHTPGSDRLFFIVWVLMHTAQLGAGIIPPKTRPLFIGAILCTSAALALQWRAPAAYRRHRQLLVFALHVIFTHLRAACVANMASEAAVGWKGGAAVGEGQRRPLGTGESPAHLLVRLFMVSGVLFRLLETLGLPLPVAQHAVIAALYFFDHALLLGWDGTRQASAGLSFYAMHSLHDSAERLLRAALAGAAPLALEPEPTVCAACPGLTVWLWLCLWVGVATPLYLLADVEAAGRRAWLKAAARAPPTQQAGGAAAAAAAAAATAPPSLRAPAAAAARPPISEGRGGHGGGGHGVGGAGLAFDAAAVDCVSFDDADLFPWWLAPRLASRALCLATLSAVSFVAASFAAHELAPRLMARRAYHLHCPAAMPFPFVDSALGHS